MNFFKKLGTKIKVIFGVLLGIFGFIAFFFVREKVRAKDQMAYDLERVESEIEIAHLRADSADKILEIENNMGLEYFV